jgi:hypothetical protein
MVESTQHAAAPFLRMDAENTVKPEEVKVDKT